MDLRLQDELKQKKPFSSIEQEASLNVVRTGAMLTDGFEQLLRPYGLSAAQYNVLRILRGSDSEGLCRNEIRDRMITRMPDMTRLLDRMESVGLVTRTRQKEDRRQVRTELTPKAHALLEEIEPKVQEEHAKRMEGLSNTELRQLIDLLTALRRSW
jgi:DNA-binding MarR family transcriptional regulator